METAEVTFTELDNVLALESYGVRLQKTVAAAKAEEKEECGSGGGIGWHGRGRGRRGAQKVNFNHSDGCLSLDGKIWSIKFVHDSR